MQSITRLLIGICFSQIMLACQHEENTADNKEKKLLLKVAENQITIDLNQNSPYFSPISRYDWRKKRYYRYNNQQHKIELYDLETGKHLKDIIFQKEGTNAINQLENFVIKDEQNIILLAAYKLYAADYEGNVKVLHDFSMDTFISNLVDQTEPLILHQGNIYGKHSSNDQTHQPIWMAGQENGELKKWGENPKKLQNSFWTIYQTMNYFCYNHDEQKILIGHRVCEEVEVIDLALKKSFFVNMATKDLGQIKSSLNTLEDLQKLSLIERLRIELQEIQYDLILYDPYRQQYIRFLVGPVREEINNENYFSVKPSYLKMLVFDKNMQYIGTAQVDKPVDFLITNQLFFTEEGIAIRKKDTDNESKEIYNIYTFQNE